MNSRRRSPCEKQARAINPASGVAGFAEAYVEGFAEEYAEGIELGEQMGQIHAFQRLPGLPETPANELEKLELGQLANLATQLESQFREGYG